MIYFVGRQELPYNRGKTKNKEQFLKKEMSGDN